MIEIILVIISYLYGSISFGLLIGKLFYGIDVREYGSGNTGGTNVSRVINKKAGFLTIILDASKSAVMVLLCTLLTKLTGLNPDVRYYCAVAAIVGHCYPIYFKFKGGKAVSVSIGYFICVQPLIALLALAVWAVILHFSKYVSLSSILATFFVACITPLLPLSFIGKCANIIIFLLMTWRHRSNIKRIMDGTESKTYWL